MVLLTPFIADQLFSDQSSFPNVSSWFFFFLKQPIKYLFSWDQWSKRFSPLQQKQLPAEGYFLLNAIKQKSWLCLKFFVWKQKILQCLQEQRSLQHSHLCLRQIVTNVVWTQSAYLQILSQAPIWVLYNWFTDWISCASNLRGGGGIPKFC